MIKYIPASRAADLSAALFSLSRPPSIRKMGEVTNFLCTTKQDLSGGLWVVLDDKRQVKVHAMAGMQSISEIVQPLINIGALAPNTLLILSQKLNACRGGFITVFDSLPDEIKAEAKDMKQMIEFKLFEETISS